MRALSILVATILAGAGALIAPASAIPPASAAVPTTLAAVTLGATDVVGGTSVTGTVRLTTQAGPGGIVVTLSSDNTAAATVPTTATVAAGATTATFTVTTSVLTNPQSALIIGTAGATTTYAILTVRPAAQFSTGSIAIIPGGAGSGTVTSQPVGIRCTIVDGTGSGTCSAFFPVGTVVRLTAQSAAGSKFQGWRGLPGCGDPSRIVVARGTTINCQPGFALK
jgi:hypothetical protein